MSPFFFPLGKTNGSAEWSVSLQFRVVQLCHRCFNSGFSARWEAAWRLGYLLCIYIMFYILFWGWKAKTLNQFLWLNSQRKWILIKSPAKVTTSWSDNSSSFSRMPILPKTAAICLRSHAYKLSGPPNRSLLSRFQ